jgi:multiple sugar transport system permease protein
VSVAEASAGLALARRRHRRRRVLIEAGSVLLAVILLIWSLIPVYNMFLIALDPEEGEIEFTGNIWPPEPSLEAFEVVLTQADRYLENFWQQFGNSLFIGLTTMVLTVLIGSMAGFAASRMRLGKGSWITNTALVTYVVPAAFLTIPFYRVVHSYGLANDPWGVIAAQVTFATPFAILILRHYASLIPVELDDAARVEGASSVQVFLRIYLPLITPALAVVAIYALVLAWNDYFYQFVLLTSPSQMTVAMMQGHLFEDPDAAWNAMMAAAIIYSLPPIVIFFALRRYMAAGLTMGGLKGMTP